MFSRTPKKLVKLALVVPCFPQLSETFIVSKFLGMLERGWDIHIVCGQKLKRERESFPQLVRSEDAARRVHVVWPHQPLWLVALLLPFAFLQALATRPVVTTLYLIRGFRRFGFGILKHSYLDLKSILLKPDVIHFEFGALAVGKMYLRELLNCKITVSFRGHDLNFCGLEEPNYYEEIWNKVDGIHCLGEDLWRRAQKRGCPPGKFHVLIPPAIPVDFFKPHQRDSCEEVGSQEHPLRLLSIARLKWTKGYEYALEACKQLRDHGIIFEYRIVGSGNYLEAVAFCRHQLGLEDGVHLLGHLPQEGVREQMKWADIFLHAAVSEGFCNAVLEAQAMELPVVTSDADGLVENVLNGVTGFVVPRRDPKALAEKISLLARDPQLRGEMGTKGRERVLNYFRLPDQIQEFERLYSNLLFA